MKTLLLLVVVATALGVVVASVPKGDGSFKMPKVEEVEKTGINFNMIESLETVRARKMRFMRMKATHGASEASQSTTKFSLPATDSLAIYLSGDKLSGNSMWEDASGKGNHFRTYHSSPAVVQTKNWDKQFKAMRFRPYQGLTCNYVVPNDHTIMIVDRYFGSHRGRTLCSSNYHRNWLLGKWAGHNGYHPGRWIYYWVAPSNNEFSLNVGTQKLNHRYNNRLSVGFINQHRAGESYNTYGPVRLKLGYGPGINEVSDADVAAVLVWDRVLTDDEINRGRDYLNEKFGIWAPPFVMPSATPVMDLTGEPGEGGSRGIRGQQGPQGQPGEPGDNGIVGDPGVVGPVGNAGSAGLRGEKGDQGPPGKAGERGFDGPLGPMGPKGERGDDGERGPRGPAGNTGVPGPNGVAGDDGVKGLRGDPGPRGDRGTQGDPGEQGDNGIEGDEGDQGDLGEEGMQGEPGLYPEGKKILATLRPRVNKVHESQKLLNRIMKRLDAKDRWGSIIHPKPQMDEVYKHKLEEEEEEKEKPWGIDMDTWKYQEPEGDPTAVSDAAVALPLTPMEAKATPVADSPEAVVESVKRQIQKKVEAKNNKAIAESCPPGQEPITESAGGCPPGQEPDVEEEEQQPEQAAPPAAGDAGAL